MRLLLVEDDARIARPTMRALGDAGHDVHWVADGRAGLDAGPEANGIHPSILSAPCDEIRRTCKGEGTP